MAGLSEFIIDHWLLVAALVVILALLAADTLKRRVLGFKDVKPQEAVRLINHEDAVMVDVRDDQEYREGHVLNAKWVPFGLMEERLPELEAYRSRPLIVYCRSGQRSAHACVLLRKHGFARLYKLSGGLLAWRGADLPVVK
jgi:rhodanese-related sulfurtransferase